MMKRHNDENIELWLNSMRLIVFESSQVSRACRDDNVLTWTRSNTFIKLEAKGSVNSGMFGNTAKYPEPKENNSADGAMAGISMGLNRLFASRNIRASTGSTD